MKYMNIKDNELYLYGEIGAEVNEQWIVEKLKELPRPLKVRINSPGGDVFAAQTIYNLLKEEEVEVQIDGECASAATLIASAGKEIRMAKNGIYAMHNPQMYINGLVKEEEMLNRAEGLKKVKATIIEVYEARTGLRAEEISQMMAEEKIMTAKEAKEKGFVDEVIEIKRDQNQQPERENEVTNRLLKEIKDQLMSGAKGLKSNAVEKQKETAIEEVARYANAIRGVR